MNLLKNTYKHRSLLLMSMPAIIIMILFNYVPMFGLVLAFKDFNFAKGIWGSDWCGLDNFRYLFVVGETAWRMTRNTVLYYLAFTVVNTIGSVMLAIGINEMVFNKTGRFFQSFMILPTFISYIAVSFVVYAFLRNDTGILNRLIVLLGGKNIRFYQEEEWWPVILIIVNMWKQIGYGSVLYLSVLAGIDQNLYEAASIDGASARQKMWYITLPMLVPMIIVKTLMGLGSIMHSDTGLFYQVTKNSPALYETTQVVDSYVLNAIMTSSDYGVTAAITFYQSIIGFLMVVITNMIIRKISPDNALF